LASGFITLGRLCHASRGLSMILTNGSGPLS
jgi:hypothetical protein